MPTRGVVYVHSTPLAVCQHVEWAIARVLGSPVRLEWSVQPVEPATRRAECSWSGKPGTGAEFATALRGWPLLRDGRGLIPPAIAARLALGASVTALGVAKIAAIAIGFVFAALLLGTVPLAIVLIRIERRLRR